MLVEADEEHVHHLAADDDAHRRDPDMIHRSNRTEPTIIRPNSRDRSRGNRPGQRRQEHHAEREADHAEWDLHQRPGDVVAGNGADAKAGGEHRRDDEGDLVCAQAIARGAMSSSTWRDDWSDRSISNDRWNFSCSSGKTWTPRWSSEPKTTPMASDSTPRVRAKHERRHDDRDVVDAGSHGRGAESAARVEHARGHRREGQQDRRRSMIRVRRTVSSVPTASKPGVMIGTICGAKIATITDAASRDR